MDVAQRFDLTGKVAVVGFWALNAAKTDHDTNPTPAVDYTAMMRAGRADHKLLVMAPTSLPSGWKATKLLVPSTATGSGARKVPALSAK